MFLLFAFDLLEPQGGADDCVGVFDSVEAAQEAAAQSWRGKRPVDYEHCEIHWIVDGQLALYADRQPEGHGSWVVVAPATPADERPVTPGPRPPRRG